MSARSSEARGTWKVERSPAVASAQLSTGTPVSGGGVPASAPASIRVTRRPAPSSPSLRRRSPSATTADAPECSSMCATSAGARRGFMGTATPPARWAAEYETSQCSASSGRRWMPTRPSGSRPASTRRRAMALAAPSHSAKVMEPDVDDGEGRAVAELLGHARQVIVHQHCLRVPPRDCRCEKLTPVSGSLQHGRCASGGQSRRGASRALLAGAAAAGPREGEAS